MKPYSVFSILLLVVTLALVTVGVLAYREMDALRYELDSARTSLEIANTELTIARQETLVAKNEIRLLKNQLSMVPTEDFNPASFYQGSYTMCRSIAEGMFGVPTDQSIYDCNGMVATAREYVMHTDEYWNVGYMGE
jgi:hypothetical protein